MNKNILIVLGVVVLLLLLGLLFKMGPAESPDPMGEDMQEAGWDVYTLEEVAQHSTEEDCWMVLDGMVLEVGPGFVSAHPGGRENILMGCGRDVTDMFMNRPTEPPSEHSPTARSLAESFQIGIVAE